MSMTDGPVAVRSSRDRGLRVLRMQPNFSFSGSNRRSSSGWEELHERLRISPDAPLWLDPAKRRPEGPAVGNSDVEPQKPRLVAKAAAQLGLRFRRPRAVSDATDVLHSTSLHRTASGNRRRLQSMASPSSAASSQELFPSFSEARLGRASTPTGLAPAVTNDPKKVTALLEAVEQAARDMGAWVPTVGVIRRGRGRGTKSQVLGRRQGEKKPSRRRQRRQRKHPKSQLKLERSSSPPPSPFGLASYGANVKVRRSIIRPVSPPPAPASPPPPSSPYARQSFRSSPGEKYPPPDETLPILTRAVAALLFPEQQLQLVQRPTLHQPQPQLLSVTAPPPQSLASALADAMSPPPEAEEVSPHSSAAAFPMPSGFSPHNRTLDSFDEEEEEEEEDYFEAPDDEGEEEEEEEDEEDDEDDDEEEEEEDAGSVEGRMSQAGANEVDALSHLSVARSTSELLEFLSNELHPLAAMDGMIERTKGSVENGLPVAVPTSKFWEYLCRSMLPKWTWALVEEDLSQPSPRRRALGAAVRRLPPSRWWIARALAESASDHLQMFLEHQSQLRHALVLDSQPAELTVDRVGYQASARILHEDATALVALLEPFVIVLEDEMSSLGRDADPRVIEWYASQGILLARAAVDLARVRPVLERHGRSLQHAINTLIRAHPPLGPLVLRRLLNAWPRRDATREIVWIRVTNEALQAVPPYLVTSHPRLRANLVNKAAAAVQSPHSGLVAAALDLFDHASTLVHLVAPYPKSRTALVRALANNRDHWCESVRTASDALYDKILDL